MAKMKLPSRVCNVLAALLSQGFTLEYSSMADGDICVSLYKNDEYQTGFFLISDRGFDMFDIEYKKMRKVLNPRVQKKSAAVLKHLEGIIEY
jgi:hypothetical protein